MPSLSLHCGAQASEAQKQAQPSNAKKAKVVSGRKSDQLERQALAKKGRKGKGGAENAVAQIADFTKSADVFRRLQEQKAL